jgi:cation diffusion facilitator family transporter
MDQDTLIRGKTIQKTLIVILVLNWLVALAKIFYGLYSKCSSITADGFHSFSDGTSNIIGLIGIHVASQPKDVDHPYGHKKYETFFSLGIAGLLFLVSYQLFEEGIRRLSHPQVPIVDVVSFIIMVATLTINTLVMRYEYKKGKVLESDLLVTDSLHTKADILTSCSVLIALVGIKLGFTLIDPIVTILIAVYIAYTAFGMVRYSSKILCDTVAIIEEEKIKKIVLGVKGVVNCHKIRSRGRPDDIHIDLHVQVSPEMHMNTAHKISYAVEEAIKKYLPQITDVVVHLEPKEESK